MPKSDSVLKNIWRAEALAFQWRKVGYKAILLRHTVIHPAFVIMSPYDSSSNRSSSGTETTMDKVFQQTFPHLLQKRCNRRTRTFHTEWSFLQYLLQVCRRRKPALDAMHKCFTKLCIQYKPQLLLSTSDSRFRKRLPLQCKYSNATPPNKPSTWLISYRCHSHAIVFLGTLPTLYWPRSFSLFHFFGSKFCSACHCRMITSDSTI